MVKSSAAPRAAGDVDVELLKAVAQAWHAQSGNPRPSRASEDPSAGARHRAGAARHRPSRFKLEAMAAAAEAQAREKPWDFAQSLLDPYELVSVARRIESGLVIADHASAAPREDDDARGAAGKRRRESRRSLRSLLLRST
ncbi:hypothetical protein U9M48_022910 [Paspalum notatum var. saurae]|uniref:Uncharacterized protein n=1 Tax=Paspalum notatum var. saurae TaxID=547442 RepID=A0AAQ3WU46_PASNO